MTPYKLVTLTDLINSTTTTTMVFLDTETCGLYGKIRLLQAYDPTVHAEPQLVEWPNPIQLAAWLTTQQHAWHNAHYDLSTIQTQSSPKFQPTHYEDTFLLSRLHFPLSDSFSLDACLELVLGFDPYKESGLNKKEMQKSSWDIPILHPAFLEYAATDVYHMPALYKEVSDKLTSTSYKLDMLTLGYCLRLQTNGLATDQVAIENRKLHNTKLIAKIGLPINANSFKQVRAFINVEESDDLALAKIAHSGSLIANKAQDVRSVRKLRKQISFLNKWDTPRIYGYFKPSARSGRLTSHKQNMQQLPRDLKGCFSAPEGRILVRGDFSQLEIRGICAITGETAMEEVLRSGGDIHDHTATVMFGANFSDEERRIAKTCNFNLLYYGSANILGTILLKDAGVNMPKNRLVLLRRKWLALYPTVARWQQDKINNWHAKKTDKTPFGREYLGNRVTDQMNIESQGFGAEVAKLALHYMYDNIEQEDGIMCNFVHDEYIAECDDDPVIYKAIAQPMASAMQESWVESCQTLKIKDLPMPVDINVARNLKDVCSGKNLTYQLLQE